MKTKFDHITDDEIRDRIVKMDLDGLESPTFYSNLVSDLERIATMAACMGRWRCWLGPVVTCYEDSGLEYDGHHRVRACKYLARVQDVQIQIPMRYCSGYLKDEAEVKKMKDEKDYWQPLSDCDGDYVSSCGDTLCK